MKLSRNLFSITLASLLLAAAAFASPSKGTLKLFEPVTVQGKQLAPGKYTVEWNGEGPNVQLNIADGKNSVTAIPARIVPVNTKNRTSGYASAKQQDGRSELTNVFFEGKAFELQIGETASQGGQPAASGSNQ
jgi:hypothetical protein